MALNLSKDDREKLERDLKAAEPYDEDEMVLDGEVDIGRIKATMAKKFLELAKEK